MNKAAEAIEEESQSSGVFKSFIAWAFIILMVYLLGAGPALWLEAKKGIGSSILDKVYTPVGWLYESTFLRRPVGMYLHLWDPEIFDKRGELVK